MEYNKLLDKILLEFVSDYADYFFDGVVDNIETLSNEEQHAFAEYLRNPGALDSEGVLASRVLGILEVKFELDEEIDSDENE